MSDRLTRSALKRIILEERRAITRKLISEGGCGCGGCSTCAQNMMKIVGSGMQDEDEHDHEDESLVISYNDEGVPDPMHYVDHAEADATHAYPYERDTDGDIVHGHDYGQSYMAKQHLHTIQKMVSKLDSVIEGDEELEDWCESKLAVAASMIQSVTEFVTYHKAASHPEAESHAPDHGMRSLMRLLNQE